GIHNPEGISSEQCDCIPSPQRVASDCTTPYQMLQHLHGPQRRRRRPAIIPIVPLRRRKVPRPLPKRYMGA
ncbi:MAG: hypothetical protein N2971_08340, partial [Chlorobi bacterium]|nr:hypothetical protein [Chlorobiota bacterium]